MIRKFIGSLAVFALPLLTMAGTAGPQLTNIETFFRSIGRIVDLLLPLVVALALLFFFWGLAKFVLAAGDEVDAAKGKNMMIWGVVTLFVMVSVWGLVSFVGNALGIQQSQNLGTTPGVGNLQTN